MMAQVESEYVADEPATEVTIGRVTDMISFNVDGPGIQNIKVRGNQWFDPLMVQCICECYCGAFYFDEKDYIDRFIRFIDEATLHRAHTLSLRQFFNQMRIKFPVEKYPRIRNPKQYAKYQYIHKSRVKDDMLIFQTYPLKRSLTVIRKEDCSDEDALVYCKQEAIQIFKMICCVQSLC